MSGALGAPAWTAEDLKDFGPLISRTVMSAFGEANSPTRTANDLYKLTRAMTTERLNALPFFYLDCGTEDELLIFNRRLADLFLERKIPHEYRELPGKHNWQFWDAQVQSVLRIAAQKMKTQ
jgi:S-formylglutathione hydrolase FrmB